MGELTDIKNRIKRLDQLEKDLRLLTRKTKTQILYKIARFTHKTYAEREQKFKDTKRRQRHAYKTSGEPSLINTLHFGVKKKQQEIVGVQLSFVRHGIFYEHGVGRGRTVDSPQANKAAKVWLNPSLNIAAEEIADLLAERYADLLAEEVRILVPGIIDTKITK